MKFLALFLGLISIVYAEAYTVYTEQMPPYNFVDEGKVVGSSTELLKALLKKNGDTIKGQIQIGPWAKGYHAVLSNKNTLIYSMARTKDRESLFKWVGPIDTLGIGLLAKKSKHVVIKDRESLHHYTIAAMYETAAESLLLSNGVRAEELDRFTNIYTQIRKLQEGRIDAVAFSIESLKALILEVGLDPDEYEVVYMLKQSELYFAFNKDTPEKKIRSLNDNLKLLKQENN
ncbi:MAG: transporter substrate-binding domain-containing protein [Sulfurospirillaceae bacterium]|nr:transporter substrate-binding domain-containing protein [Sulfurospirillaceae bacterium]